jgi:copper(I)-binding protein
VRKLALVGALILAGCQQNPPPKEQQAAGVEIEQAWTRDTVGRTANAAVFMTVTASSADRLVGAATDVADESDLMTMTMDGGTMAMSYVDAIDLAAGEAVSLDPSGLHVWLEGLKAPLKAGQTFTLELKFEKAGARDIEVKVVEPGGQPEKMPGM